MTCDYFGLCGSCKLYELDYTSQLEYKTDEAKKLFEPLHVKNFDIIKSDEKHYRSRAEFQIWHEGDDLFFAMNKREGHGKLPITKCPKVDPAIDALMPRLIELLRPNEMLRHKLFAVEFLSAREEMLVTLIYHKKLDEHWDVEAQKVAEALTIKLIGRSRKVKRVLNDDFVLERLHVKNEDYTFKMIEGGFSQPNRHVNEQMISWVKEQLDSATCKDLLELYCGHGNFTIPLSRDFNKVLATEISKTSIKAATYNCEANEAKNVTFVRMSSEELTSALKKERPFQRLRDIDLDSFDFSHVFVDPPRAGLDEQSRGFVQGYETILYVSCNPETLRRDLDVLTQTHTITAFAFFDQFPYTSHLESGVILKRKG